MKKIIINEKYDSKVIGEHLIPLIDFLKNKGGIPVEDKWVSERTFMVYRFTNKLDFESLAQEVVLPSSFQVNLEFQTIFDINSGLMIAGGVGD